MEEEIRNELVEDVTDRMTAMNDAELWMVFYWLQDFLSMELDEEE